MWSSSFIVGNYRKKNAACFAGIRHNGNNGRRAIIIEKDKQFDGTEFIISYIEDLINMGFKISKYIFEKSGNLIINIDKKATVGEVVSLSMALRYLWENRYIVSKYGEDDFKLIIEAYRKIKSFKWTGLNNLELLCLAHNMAMTKDDLQNNYNANHCWVDYGNTCKIVKNLDGLNTKSYVNGFFTSNKLISGFTEVNKKLCITEFENWRKKDIQSLL